MAEQKKSPTKYRPRSVLPKELEDTGYVTCVGACGKTKKKEQFYKSPIETNPIGVIPYCKTCSDRMIREDGDISEKKLKDFLKNPLVDRPFDRDIYNSTIINNKNLGFYLKQLSLGKMDGLKWKDGEVDEERKVSNTIQGNIEYVVEESEEKQMQIVTDDMVRMWGVGLKPEEYIMLDELYNKLSMDFEIDTGVQDEYLKNACVCQMRNKIALANDEPAVAEKWGKQFDNYMASGKLKPNQISASDKMGGITNFSTFYQYVEKSENFIPDFPDIMLDDIDYAIYSILNYIRKLFGLEPIQLGDVKDFTTYEYERGQEIIFPNKKSDGDD